MIDNITEKVVKRLTRVTIAMKQDGENRVGLIQRETKRKVSQKLAEASATQPSVVGAALNEIGQEDPELLQTVMDVVETEKLIDSGAPVSVLPRDTNVIVQVGPDGAASSSGAGAKAAAEEGQGAARGQAGAIGASGSGA